MLGPESCIVDIEDKSRDISLETRAEKYLKWNKSRRQRSKNRLKGSININWRIFLISYGFQTLSRNFVCLIIKLVKGIEAKFVSIRALKSFDFWISARQRKKGQRTSPVSSQKKIAENAKVGSPPCEIMIQGYPQSAPLMQDTRNSII